MQDVDSVLLSVLLSFIEKGKFGWIDNQGDIIYIFFLKKKQQHNI